MIRVFVLYPEAPDPERYERHVELCRRELPDVPQRHGRVFGSPTGKPDVAYYFEYEFPDMEAFRAAGPGLQKAAQDAQDMGVEFRVYFAEIE
jgi:hypothetical protein